MYVKSKIFLNDEIGVHDGYLKKARTFLRKFTDTQNSENYEVFKSVFTLEKF